MKTPEEIKKGLSLYTPEEIKAILHQEWSIHSHEKLYRSALAYIKQLEADKEHLGLLRAADAEAYRHKLHELEALVPRWISVEERLPENGLAIVCCPDPDRPVYIAWMCDGRWLNQFSRPLGLPVTHWMPLPEPPKEETT